MNLEAFRTALEHRVGTAYSDAYLTSVVNAAVHHVETEHDWPWLEATESINTSSGDSSYPADDTWRRTVSLRLPSGFQLEQVTIEEVDRYTVDSGEPKFFAVFGDELVVGPTPSSTLSLQHRYVRTEPDLVGDSDTPILPVTWHLAVVEYAAYTIHRRENDSARAEAALAAYRGWIERMDREASRLSPSVGGGEPLPERS